MNLFTCNPMEYASYRPQYPNSLFEYLRDIVDARQIVLECGAGSGQASQGLACYFEQVIALDASFELLSQAEHKKNILYVETVAEQLPIKSDSIHLLCVAQAMHWFDLDKFYVEVKRVMKSNGIIASWCYNKAIIEMQIDSVINDVHEKISERFVASKERQYVHDKYLTIPFPFSKIKSPSFKINANWNLHQWLGYMNTWPGVIEFRKKYNLDLVAEASDEILIRWGNPNDIKVITWPIHLLLGRIEK